MDDDPENYEIECSYCGASLYYEAAQCGKCGNFTDGQGPLARAERPGGDKRPLSRFWTVTGWIVVIALALPFLLVFIAWLNRQ